MLKKNLLIYAFLAIIVSFIVYLTFNLDQVGYFSLKNNQRITNYYHNQIYLALFTSAAFVLFGYLSLGSLLIINSRPVNFIYTKKQDIVIRTFIIISAVICIITLWFAPETSFTNLIKNIFEKSIPNRIDNLELRLSMQNLPTALQFIFELERRIITPFLLIEIFCRPSQVNISRWYKILLLIIASFNILYTIDRSIEALYVFVVLATHLHQNGIKFLMEKKFYFLLSLLFTCVVVLKHFQYGEFWSHEKMKNLHWTNNYTETGNIKIPALNKHLVASEKIETKNNPLLPENFENNSHPETRSSKTFKKEN